MWSLVSHPCMCVNHPCMFVTVFKLKEDKIFKNVLKDMKLHAWYRFLTHVRVDISWYLLLKTIPQHKHWTHLSSIISKIMTVEAIIRLETGNTLNVFKIFYVRRIFRGNMLLETHFILMLWVSSNKASETIYNCKCQKQRLFWHDSFLDLKFISY